MPAAKTPSSPHAKQRSAVLPSLGFLTFLAVVVGVVAVFVYPIQSSYYAIRTATTILTVYYDYKTPDGYTGPSSQERALINLLRASNAAEKSFTSPDANDPLQRDAQRRGQSTMQSILPLLPNTLVDPMFIDSGSFETRIEWVMYNTTARTIGELNPTKAVVFLQAGGFTASNEGVTRGLASYLSKAVGVPVVCVWYTPVPEKDVDGQIDQIRAAYRVIRQRGITAGNTVFVGASAGGTLALLTSETMIAEKKGSLVPAGLVLWSPWALWVPLEEKPEEYESFAKNKDRDVITMPEPTWKYLKSGVALAGKRRIKQLAKAPMAEMPPMFVTAGEWEVMADSIVNWAHKASADGGKVELKVYPFMQHCFQYMYHWFPEADRALQESAAWIRDRLGMNNPA